jgi:hypothetical protein
MSDWSPASVADGALNVAFRAAGTDGPEADPPEPVAADAEPRDTQADGHDLDSVEHVRQSRLSRWRKQP